MSGIAGLIDWGRDVANQAGVVDAMLDRIRHRGPDGVGKWTSPSAILGHRRLGIIDPEGDRQPMTRPRGNSELVVVLDGEIYNAAELRKTLESKGCVFRTRAHAEIVLHAFHEWGDDCVTRFDGEFALAVWDGERRRLFLARDPLGIKPLFFFHRGTSFAFGSEIKALLVHPDVETVLSTEGLTEVIVAPPTITTTPGITPFRDVRELRPGRTLAIENGEARENVYWKLVSQPHTDSLETTVERVRALLLSAVEKRLASDVPLAITLSGGIDSSAILSIASQTLRANKKDVPAWSVDFVDGDKHFASMAMMPTRDAPFAAMAAAAYATSHQTVVLDPATMADRFLDAMRARDLPIATQRDTSLILLCEKLRPTASVILSGVGSDELFAGYHWLPNRDPNDPLSSFPWLGVVPKGKPWPPWIAEDVIAQARPIEYLIARNEEARAEIPRLEGEDEAAANHREDMFVTVTRRLPYMLDRKERMSMFAGVHDRAPFTDPSLVQYMWNVPEAMRRVDNYEKGLLRRALDGLLLDDIRSRKKSAFPANQDPAYAALLADRVREVVRNSTGVAATLINPKGVDELLAAPNPFLLETVLQLEAWLREYRVRLP